jgi:hypothetical protein
MLQVILTFIVFFTAMLIFSVVTTGYLMTTGLSASILDAGGIMDFFSGGGNGYVTAGLIGGGLLFAFASVIPGLIYTKGVCIIYINKTADMDFAQAEAKLESGIASVKKKADEARERARQLTPQQPVAAVPAQAAHALACPNCHAPVAADDAFCGNCAHKLK